MSAPDLSGAPGAAAPEPAHGSGSGSGSGQTGNLAHDRPEILVGGAFVGAFLFAKILRRISS